jgi:hypothetical protein
MSIETLVPVIVSVTLVAVSGLFSNMFLFRYQFKKERDRKTLERQITKLLLPLFYTLKDYELALIEVNCNENGDIAEYVAHGPKNLLKKIITIVKDIYLADEDLHQDCLKFLEWAYSVDVDKRFEDAMVKGVDESIIRNLTDTVTKKYRLASKRYLRG